MSLGSIWKELRRRRVIRVAVVYAVAAWVIMQIGEVAFPALDIPDWALSFLVVLAVLCFPIAVILAWAFDMTPGGVVRTGPADDPPGDAGAGIATASTEAQPPTEAGSRTATPPHTDTRPHTETRPETGTRPPTEARTAAERPVAPRPSKGPGGIAVLPFMNRSDDAEDVYFSDGITEELITRLSRLGGIRVISRSSAWQYRGHAKSAREIADELGVSFIVEGSVRRGGDRVRVMAQLVDATEDETLWAESYDHEIRDLFDIQADLASRIASSLGSRLEPAGAAYSPPGPAGIDPGRTDPTDSEPPTSDLEAYDLYLKGRYAWNRRTEEDLVVARELFERAAARDPEFALARVGLADTLVTMAVYGTHAPAEVMPAARAAAETALALGSGRGEARVALACVRAMYEWRWREAGALFAEAVAESPGYATGHQWLATNYLVPLGRFDEAASALDRARELDPERPSIAASYGALLYFSRDYERALAALARGVDDHPGFAFAYFMKGMTEIELGRREVAVESLERARRLGGSPETVAGLAVGLALAGGEARARELLGELEQSGAVGYVSSARIAQVHAALDEPDAALARLSVAAQERSVDLVWLDVSPRFDALRGIDAFGTLRRQVFDDV